MSHPPIPPNCRWFFHADFPYAQIKRKLVFLYERDDEAFPLDDVPDSMKYIIAAVARCAWLDEHDRIIKETNALPDAEKWERVNSPDFRFGLLTIEENAKAWGKWGKQ